MIHLLKLEQMKFLVWSWQQKTAYKYKHKPKPIEHLRTAVNWASPLGMWVTSRLAIVAIVTSQNQMYLLFNLTALHLNWYQMLVNSCVLSATRWRRWAPTGSGVETRHVLLGGGPGVHTGAAGVNISIGWPGNALLFPRISWRRWLAKGRSGLLCLSCCPRDPTSRKKMDNLWVVLSGFREFSNSMPNS